MVTFFYEKKTWDIVTVRIDLRYSVAGTFMVFIIDCRVSEDKSSLRIKNIQEEDGGMYTVVIQTTLGKG